MTPAGTADRTTGVRGTEAIRTDFPALTREHGGRPVAYFDGPGGTQVPRAVVEAMADYLYAHNANTAWRYPTSIETDEIIADARRTLADFLNAEPGEVAFGANMTTLTFHVARALGREWKEGDEVIVTELDHHANVDPWRALERDRGIRIRNIPVDPEAGRLDWGALERTLHGRTRLLAIGAASNAIGTITDVAAAARLAHDAGALVFVDAVHYAPHGLVDVVAMQCDLLACSAYKFYGPHVGVLFARDALLEALDVPKLVPAPDDGPERLETGTQSHEGIAGAAAAVEFLASIGGREGERRQRLRRAYEALHRRGSELLTRLWRGLESIDGVRLFGPPPEAPRTPTLSFTVEGLRSEDVAASLAGQGIFVSHGDFYATTLVERLGEGNAGLVRAGCACYTTAEEVDALVDGVRSVALDGAGKV